MIYLIQKHLFKRILKSFVFFNVLLFLTYTLLDFCTKAADFSESTSFHYWFMLKFYGCEFAKRAHLFIPICFNLSMLLQFIRLLKTKELIALLSAGIPYKTIIQPYWILAFILSSALFINRESITPPTREFLENFRNDHIRAVKKSKSQEDQIFALILKDDSKLIYQSFDPEKKRFFDLYWVISPERLLRIKYLDHTDYGFKASFVDELVRNQTGTLLKKHSFKELNFSKQWLKGSRFDKSLPIQTQTITGLMKGLVKKEFPYSKDEIFTELLLVTVMAVSPLWLVAIQAPILKRYTRQIPILFYVAGQLLFFFCTYTILEGLGTIAQRSIASPWILIFIPAMLKLTHLIYRYRKQIVCV
jgi:lipopolysaccharide export LptBFGC system permease protein LptF